MLLQVKINASVEEMLAFAAEMFGDKSVDEVLTVCLQVGHSLPTNRLERCYRPIEPQINLTRTTKQ